METVNTIKSNGRDGKGPTIYQFTQESRKRANEIVLISMQLEELLKDTELDENSVEYFTKNFTRLIKQAQIVK